MISEQELRKRIRLEAFEAGGQKVYAAKHGVSAAVLSLFASGARKPSKTLLDVLGYEAVTVYRKKQQPKGQR